MRDENGKYINQASKSSLLRRVLWNISYIFLFRIFPTFIFRRWRIFILNIFGAQVHSEANVYCTARILQPWKLKMGELACIGPHVICENDVMVTIEERATVSQYSYICTSSHDIYHYGFDLQSAPITIKKDAWVAAGSFVGKGRTIGEGAVVAAKSVVIKDVEPWTVVGGNPAKFIKMRMINNGGGG